MASWQDGAEYAPHERPDGFASPRVAVLPQAPPLIDPAAHQPLNPPHVFEQRTPTVPLEALVPAVGPTRDPHQAFSSSAPVSTGAWGAAHADGAHAAAAWTPEDPLVTSSDRELRHRVPLGPPSGQPVGAVSQFAPPQGAPVAPGAFPPPSAAPEPWGPPRGASMTGPNGASLPRQIIAVLGWPTLALLALGFVVRPLAAAMLLVTALIGGRSKQVGSQVSRLTWLAFAAALVLGLIVPTGTGTWDSVNGWARWACLVVLILDVIVAYRAITSRRR